LIFPHVNAPDFGHCVVGWPYQIHTLNMCEKKGHLKLYAIVGQQITDMSEAF